MCIILLDFADEPSWIHCRCQCYTIGWNSINHKQELLNDMSAETFLKTPGSWWLNNCIVVIKDWGVMSLDEKKLICVKKIEVHWANCSFQNLSFLWCSQFWHCQQLWASDFQQQTWRMLHVICVLLQITDKKRLKTNSVPDHTHEQPLVKLTNFALGEQFSALHRYFSWQLLISFKTINLYFSVLLSGF